MLSIIALYKHFTTRKLGVLNSGNKKQHKLLTSGLSFDSIRIRRKPNFIFKGG